MATLDTTVGEYYGKNQIKGEVGVEIEIEASNRLPPQDEIGSSWYKEHDGSLRGEYNAEYVFNGPVLEASAYRRIDSLSRVIGEWGTAVDETVRAGVHVHINVRGLTLRKLWTFITCYYILEEVLTDTCGVGRQGNHFCLRFIDSELALPRLLTAVRGNELLHLEGETLRYSALNLTSLVKFGSLEFRQLRTPRDFSVIKRWISLLLSIKRNSELFPDPEAVVGAFSYGGEEQFLNTMVGEHRGMFNFDHEMERALHRGVRVVQDIAYVREW